VYIVIENKPPHIVTLFMATDDYVNYGVKEFERLISEFKNWRDLGFPTVGYSKSGSEEMYELGLPAWVKN